MDASRRRRGCRADVPWRRARRRGCRADVPRRIAAVPRLPRGRSVESRRRRGHDVDIPWTDDETFCSVGRRPREGKVSARPPHRASVRSHLGRPASVSFKIGSESAASPAAIALAGSLTRQRGLRFAFSSVPPVQPAAARTRASDASAALRFDRTTARRGASPARGRSGTTSTATPVLAATRFHPLAVPRSNAARSKKWPGAGATQAENVARPLASTSSVAVPESAAYLKSRFVTVAATPRGRTRRRRGDAAGEDAETPRRRRGGGRGDVAATPQRRRGDVAATPRRRMRRRRGTASERWSCVEDMHPRGPSTRPPRRRRASGNLGPPDTHRPTRRRGPCRRPRRPRGARASPR